jgi:hypothetical protein
VTPCTSDGYTTSICACRRLLLGLFLIGLIFDTEDGGYVLLRNVEYLFLNYSAFNDELQNLNSSPNIIRMIKSSRVRRAGYVA